MIRASFIVSMLACALASGLVVAQNEAAPVPKTTADGVTYISGGVGAGQQQAMKAVMNDYNLRLTFARQQSGAFLAGVKVTIEGAAGPAAGTLVLDTESIGPMLFARLPVGKYQVRAMVGNQVQSRSVDVGQAGARDLVIHFPGD